MCKRGRTIVSKDTLETENIPMQEPISLEQFSQKIPKYTALSFAPIPNFIEKSRRLRELYGASQILSYLSWKIVRAAQNKGVAVILPAIANDDIVQGIPSHILVMGNFSCSEALKALMEGWEDIVNTCYKWLQENLNYELPELTNSTEWAVAWTKWKMQPWQIFWGDGETIETALQDLEARKLRRDWGASKESTKDSSQLPDRSHNRLHNQLRKGTIAYTNEDKLRLSTAEIKRIYQCIAKILDPASKGNDFIPLNKSEGLNILELIKRLVTYEAIAKKIHRDFYSPRFREMLLRDENRGGTYWNAWFMGDGDRVNARLTKLKDRANITQFSHSLRAWGQNFSTEVDRGLMAYVGGYDFLGVMHREQEIAQLKSQGAIEWLIDLHNSWQQENLGIILSVGFVWAGHLVSPRDILRHCREAEKFANHFAAGQRDRVTIRILFDNGQYVQWTTPWQYLQWLADYRDRDGHRGKDANWSHSYTNLLQLKAQDWSLPVPSTQTDEAIALNLFGLYFGSDKQEILSQERSAIVGAEDSQALIAWIEGIIQVGWHLCSNI
ncbi:hypothetical protein PseudUWO310_06030 [Pseudanabaena sp. UWO310]|nr:hypothetical protein PseudUWO310_06030 [Pseudanabaena sp. UWO310]